MGSLIRILARLTIATTLLSVLGCSAPGPERGADEIRPSSASGTPKVPSNADTGGALRVTLYGIGPVRAGMSIAEASSALGATLELPGGADATACNYLRWSGSPDGIFVMVENLRIARVDIRSGTIATQEGARIGDSAERIRQLYSGRVTASPHKYTDGQYLTIAPSSPADDGFRLVFETEAGRVTRYRSGRLPQVEYVEGCS